MATSIQYQGREIVLPRGWEPYPEASNEFWQWIRHPEWGAIGVCESSGVMEVRDNDEEHADRVKMPLKAIATALQFVGDDF